MGIIGVSQNGLLNKFWAFVILSRYPFKRINYIETKLCGAIIPLTLQSDPKYT